MRHRVQKLLDTDYRTQELLGHKIQETVETQLTGAVGDSLQKLLDTVLKKELLGRAHRSL